MEVEREPSGSANAPGAALRCLREFPDSKPEKPSRRIRSCPRGRRLSGARASGRQQSRRAVLIGRRGDRLAGIGGCRGLRRRRDVCLCVLIVRDEGAQRADLRTCGSSEMRCAAAFAVSRSFATCSWRWRLSRILSAHNTLHRFDGGVAQMHRIEIELKMRQQRRCRPNDQDSADDHRHAMPFQKPVGWRKSRKADGMRLSRRFYDGQKRGKHRDTGRKSDQHADARNLSKFGEAAVISRQKEQKPTVVATAASASGVPAFGRREQSGAEIGWSWRSAR